MKGGARKERQTGLMLYKEMKGGRTHLFSIVDAILQHVIVVSLVAEWLLGRETHLSIPHHVVDMKGEQGILSLCCEGMCCTIYKCK